MSDLKQILFNYLNPKGAEPIKKLRFDLSDLRDHKFKHSFQDYFKPISNFGAEIETAAHYLLHCGRYLHERKTVLENIKFGPPKKFRAK